MTALHDTIVIGAGPSGTTAAHLLAKEGADVLLIDRAEFPRFVIGESLLPCSLPVFERLGVTLDNDPRYLRKYGAEFFREGQNQVATYPFADSQEADLEHAFQVDRAALDQTLLDAAVARGVSVRLGENVQGVDVSNPAFVEVRTTHGSHRARYLIDASGAAALLARLHQSRRRIDDFGLVAVYRHYGDLRPAIAEELARTGNIKILFQDDGWVWVIPLSGGRLSLGLVSREPTIKGRLDAAIAKSPELKRLLEGAACEDSDVVTRSFSFHNEKPQGSRYLAIGDAACFLDPIFSSGVSFGMVGAVDAADTFAAALKEGREGESGLMDGHVEHMTRGYSVFASLILATYKKRLLPDLFFAEEQDPALRRGITALLSGNVWMTDNPFQKMMWRSKRRRFKLHVHRAGHRAGVE